ncbi:MAG: hypothetical protein LBF84_04085 [Holosporales bacterium]|jgi:hypothetical protein|nr:hypothetical protein [Holosporales bacterium]
MSFKKLFLLGSALCFSAYSHGSGSLFSLDALACKQIIGDGGKNLAYISCYSVVAAAILTGLDSAQLFSPRGECVTKTNAIGYILGTSTYNIVRYALGNIDNQILYSCIGGGIGAIAGWAKPFLRKVFEDPDLRAFAVALCLNSLVQMNICATICATILSLIMYSYAPSRLPGIVFPATYFVLNFFLQEKLGLCGVTAIAATIGAITFGIAVALDQKRKVERMLVVDDDDYRDIVNRV